MFSRLSNIFGSSQLKLLKLPRYKGGQVVEAAAVSSPLNWANHGRVEEPEKYHKIIGKLTKSCNGSLQTTETSSISQEGVSRNWIHCL